MKRVFAHIGFSAGVTLIVLNLLEIKYAYAITIGLVAIFAASLILPFFRQNRVVPVCAGAAVMAGIILICFYNGTVKPQLDLDKSSADVRFYITDVAEYNGEGYRYTVKTTNIEKPCAPQNIKLVLYSENEIKANEYQAIDARVRLFSLGQNAFSSYGYWGKGVYLGASLDDYKASDENIKSPWRYILKLRKDIITSLSNNVKGDSGALAVALITGNKMKLSSSSYDNFKYAGASHIMAVSGFHLTVMIGAACFLLKRLRLNDKWISVISSILIFCIIGLAGFSKSVIRAGIMMLVMLFARLISRRADGLNSLGFAVFVICLNPFAVSDIGAVLSVLSVLSLLTLHPHLVRLLDKDAVSKSDGFVIATYGNKFITFGANGFLVALSVMIYTIPAMYLFFGYVSLVGLVSNILVVPLGSVCIILSLITYLSIKINVLSFALSRLCSYVNAFLLWLVHRFSSLENSVVAFSQYFSYVVAVIFIAFAICFFMNNKRLMKFTGVISSIAVVALLVVFSVSGRGSANILVCENGAVAISCNDTAVVYNVTTKGDYYNVKQFLAPRHKYIDTIISPDNNKYSRKLLDRFNCRNYVTSRFSSELLKNNSIYTVEYCLDYFEQGDIDLKYYKNYAQPYCLLYVNNVTIAIGDELSCDADITINEYGVSDTYGVISLNDNEIMYTINNAGVYSARRVDAWQE